MRYRGLGYRAVVLMFSITACTILATLFVESVSFISGNIYARQHPTAIFEYFSVEYSGPTVGNAGLAMESVAAWYEPVDQVIWVDQLRCKIPPGDGAYGIFSTITNRGTIKTASPLGSAVWTYTGAVPSDGRTCFVRSNITVENRGTAFQQTVDSGPFETPQR